jgi:glucose/mannose transport system permease protein
VLLPGVLASIVFVYLFIAYTVKVSFSAWNSLIKNDTFVGFRNYLSVFKSFRFRSDIRNMIYYTALFIFLVIVLGLLISIILNKRMKGFVFFRSVFLLPMSLSYIVTGVVWRWLLNPAAGINLLFGTQFKWYTDTAVFPAIKIDGIAIGFPVALFSIVIASVWQFLGFAIALYLSGLTAIPKDIYEAASIDGANEWQLNTRIIIPILRQVTISVFILLFQISLKVFDLIYTMTGAGPNFVTDMPAINMYESTFRGHFYGEGSVIAVCMLLIVVVFVIPYQVFSRKE